ncbi:hypothetical protein [Burkholderia sp. 3C]
MHVISALSSDFYEVEFAGKPANQWNVFPDWNPHDRFGILIYDPLAALGATHLIQVACMCFYDVKPSRREERKIYPEIFAIHVGEWWGGYGYFDFWPARREVCVPNDHQEILGALNDRGITRLALPERPARELVHRRKEEDCALEGLATAVFYSPSGRVDQADFTIRSNDRRSERDVHRVLDRPQLATDAAAKLANSRVPIKEGDPDFASRQQALNVNIDDTMREAARRQRESLKVDELITESYRFVRPEVALKCL